MNKIKRRLSMTINGGNGPLGTITADQLRKPFYFLQIHFVFMFTVSDDCY